jgi:hypothetical protein
VRSTAKQFIVPSLAIAALIVTVLVTFALWPSPSVSRASAADPTGDPHLSTSGSPFVVTQLALSTTYGGGQVRFDPPPPTFAPTITASQAYAAYTKTGLYPDAPTYSTPTIRLASYTDYGSGTANASGAIVPSNVQRRVWMITFTNVPDVASVGASAPGQPTSSAKPVLHSIVVVVDATSGVATDLFSGIPDVVALPAPPSE